MRFNELKTENQLQTIHLVLKTESHIPYNEYVGYRNSKIVDRKEWRRFPHRGKEDDLSQDRHLDSALYYVIAFTPSLESVERMKSTGFEL